MENIIVFILNLPSIKTLFPVYIPQFLYIFADIHFDFYVIRQGSSFMLKNNSLILFIDIPNFLHTINSVSQFKVMHFLYF